MSAPETVELYLPADTADYIAEVASIAGLTAGEVASVMVAIHMHRIGVFDFADDEVRAGGSD